MRVCIQYLLLIAILTAVGVNTGCRTLAARKARKVAAKAAEQAKKDTVMGRVKTKAETEIKYGRVLLRVLMAVAVGTIAFGLYMCVSVGLYRGVSTVAMGIVGFIVALTTSAYIEVFMWLFMALFLVIALYVAYIGRRRFAQVVETMQRTKHGRWTNAAAELANGVQDTDTQAAVAGVKKTIGGTHETTGIGD